MRLFEDCVPLPRRIFIGPTALQEVLHINEYVMDKAFVYGVVMLSKWLGSERLPGGVYGLWPPDPPPEAFPPEVGEEADVEGAGTDAEL